MDFLRNPDKYRKLGARVPKGILFVGPPGTGKTLMAKAIAGEAGVAFLECKSSALVEMFVGVGALRVRNLFELGRRASPCIIFLDEMDEVGKSRSSAFYDGGHGEREQTLAQILAEMDGFEENSGLMVIAATNRPEVLDEAIRRSGRFDEQLVFPLPDVKGREEILKIHCRNVRLDPAVDLKDIARQTPLGVSGADLENMVNRAALIAVVRGNKSVGKRDLLDGLDRVLYGIEHRKVMSPEDKKRTAYHEAGHTLVAKLLAPNTDSVLKVTTVPRGMSGGATHFLPEADKFLFTDTYLLARIRVAMGGGVSEELIFNNKSTGAGHDFAAATQIARKMICEFGMSETIGRAVIIERSQFLKNVAGPMECSPETQRKIDEEIRQLLDKAYLDAKNLLSEPKNRKKLTALAEALLDKETLDSAEIDQIIASAS